MILPTCESCEHFRLFFGEKRGECYGNPPAVFASGSHTSGETPAPKVKANRPACWAHKALPEGTPPVEKGKVTPETPGDALKLAHATNSSKQPEPVSGVALAPQKRRK
jgi:hypothetical protein